MFTFPENPFVPVILTKDLDEASQHPDVVTAFKTEQPALCAILDGHFDMALSDEKARAKGRATLALIYRAMSNVCNGRLPEVQEATIADHLVDIVDESSRRQRGLGAVALAYRFANRQPLVNHDIVSGWGDQSELQAALTYGAAILSDVLEIEAGQMVTAETPDWPTSEPVEPELPSLSDSVQKVD